MMHSLVFILDFFLMGLVAYVIRQRYLRDAYSATSAASIVMALAVFVLSVLPFLPIDALLLTPYLTLLLLIIWLFTAESYLRSYLNNIFYIHTRNTLNRFSFGTWVVSTGLISALWLNSFRGWEEIGWILAAVAVGVWIEYIRIIINDMQTITKSSLVLKLNGSIFLATISTQTIGLLLDRVLGGWLPLPMFFIFIALGYIFYGASLILLLRYYQQRHWHQAEWSHTNCLVHGALSISGIACISIGIIPNSIILTTWVLAALFFIFVEGIAVCRVIVGVRKRGVRQTVWRYDVSQWTRNFTYGIFYAFTTGIAEMQLGFLKPLMLGIVHYGQWVVASFLLIEITLFFHAKYKPVPAKPSLNLKDANK